MWDDIFFADFKSFELIETKMPSGEMAVTGIAHFYRTPSIPEVVIRIAIPFFSWTGVAAYVAAVVSSRKIRAGSLAAACGTFIAFGIIQFYIAHKVGDAYRFHPINLAIWGVVSLAFGAIVSWVAAVWWPNKSLERMRDT
jgi:hypothetical protein